MCSKGENVYYPENGLISYLSFDSGFEDKQGYLQTLSGSSASFVPGVSGNAASFDGKNQILLFTESIFNKNGSELTTSFWFNTSTTTSTTQYLIYLYDCSFGIGNNVIANTVSIPATSSAFSNYLPNSWNHVVGTYDGKTIKIFINGNFKASTEWPGKIFTNYNIVGAMGGHKRNGNINEFFKGSIDEFLVYNRILTDKEINQLYTLGK